MMNRYIYIVALKEMTSPDLKFRHAFIDAENAAHAYDTGFSAIKVDPTEGRVNDYVVELKEKQ